MRAGCHRFVAPRARLWVDSLYDGGVIRTKEGESPVGKTPEALGGTPAVTALGFEPGQVVQELGWDEDVDETLRDSIMEAIDADMIEDPLEAVDSVVLWWREDDGDVADGLVDALRDLSQEGHIWLFTPKIGHDGHVDPTDIAEATLAAGLVLANPATVSSQWQAQRIVRPKGGRR